jgi:transcriptional regulator GlxA family with amidase domain
MIRIGLILYSQFQLINLAVTTVFEYANESVPEPVYELTLLSEEGGPVTTSSGVVIETEPFGAKRFDTLLVFGDNHGTVGSPGLLEFLRRSAPLVRRLGGPCTGAFNLAGAGLLDGRRATTHWLHAMKMRHDHPRVRLMEDRIFVQDEGIWTSAGASACIDLALAFVEQDLGIEVAKLVAKMLVVFHRRAGGQSQHSALLEMGPRSDRIQKALAYAKENLHQELSVDKLAQVAHLSPRQFARTFAYETGLTPAKAIERLRLEAAREMMGSSNVPLETVAKDTGFGDADRMRRAFIRLYGQTPQVIRRGYRTELA